jgi:methylenetetrahydrofolate dehydrogenase (NADP+)/methenyltetrahydrofolate cyclohydrolase
MVAKLLDGKLVADKIQSDIATKVQAMEKKNMRVPGLAVVIVGSDPASKIYVNNKRIACKKVGFHSLDYDLPEDITQHQLERIIDDLNASEHIDGIIVQAPLPSHLDYLSILEKIDYRKDVDGFHPYNVGRLAVRAPLLRPCTPLGIITLLAHYQIPLKGLNAVIVGASNIVGRPMALELLLKKATVTVCHKFTSDLAARVNSADLLITAVGNFNVISSSWLKEGSIVVDVGINRLANGKICGDLDFKTAVDKAAWITPVPGGVGPMTVSMLLQNTLWAYEKKVALTLPSPTSGRG